MYTLEWGSDSEIYDSLEAVQQAQRELNEMGMTGSCFWRN
ncbi:hypothetical protein MMUR_47750 [Mycolicibacterium murale]|uniref:Uncharacterized protein n=1 Tax=Mycolicibacterium murale TaxID=182220 RepID=A0A7I9WST3_9MYCO|nr:hypothetical protein MMUR_47750 [Mycolicibacterium murale]